MRIFRNSDPVDLVHVHGIRSAVVAQILAASPARNNRDRSNAIAYQIRKKVQSVEPLVREVRPAKL
jgi:hypothetical protein